MNPPGWYPSPTNPGYMQYWDGLKWTPGLKTPAEVPLSELPPPSAMGPAGGIPPEPDWDLPSRARPRTRSTPPSMGAAAFLMIFGLLWIGLGSAPLARSISDSRSSAPTAQGTVVDVAWSTSRSRNSTSSSSQRCSPVAEFSVDGKTYRAGSSLYTSPCRWAAGQDIEVIYDAANPANARVKAGKPGPAAYVFPAIGAGIMVFGAVMAVKVRRGRRTPEA